jgi:inosine-uridine nucleoside N-ribohydrolase
METVSQGGTRTGNSTRSKKYESDAESWITNRIIQRCVQNTLLTTGLFLATLLITFTARGAQTERYVIFDNDFYGPASTNLQAAALLLNSDAKTLGLTVVTGDGWRDEEVAHALRLLEIFGRTDVPVVPGAVFPLVSTKAKQQYPHEVTIVAAGSLTNLALAIRLDPEFASLAKELIFMGGLIGTGFFKATGNPDFASDFNLLFDPEAAEIVLTADWPKITAVGDVTNDTMFTAELVKRIAQTKTPLTEYIAKYAETGLPLWDELTVGIFVDPTLVTKQTAVAMDVDLSHGPAYGTARIWSDAVAPHLGERKVNIVQTVDVDRFVDEFVSAVQWTPTK